MSTLFQSTKNIFYNIFYPEYHNIEYLEIFGDDVKTTIAGKMSYFFIRYNDKSYNLQKIDILDKNNIN